MVTIGWLTRISTCTKITPKTAARAKQVRITVDVQPRSWPSSRAYVSANSAPTEVITPGRSMLRGPALSRDSRMAAAPSASVARPNGTLTKKIQPQLTYWLSTPPNSGPTARASALTPLQIPTAAARCRGLANVAEMIASVVGVTRAAPSPCTARLMTRTSTFPANPAASEATVKIDSPLRNSRFRPQTSASRPPASSRLANTRMYELTTHSSPEVVRCKSRSMTGMATLTMLLSRYVMKVARATATNVQCDRSADTLGASTPL